MSTLPPPRDPEAAVGELVGRAGRPSGAGTVGVCVDLLGGADRLGHLPELAYLDRLPFAAGSATLDPARWPTTGSDLGEPGAALRLDGRRAPGVVAGLGDEHWRPAEMCLKVATRHEVGRAGRRPSGPPTAFPGCGRRRCALGAAGDTEHVEAVRDGSATTTRTCADRRLGRWRMTAPARPRGGAVRSAAA